MATYYISPYRRMAQLRKAFDRMVSDDFLSPANNGRTSVHIPMDVKVDDEAFEITAIVPGLESDDLSIQVLDDTITIRGELSSTVEEDASYLLQEIPSGEFRRVIKLPVTLDPEKAEARINNGVLRLHVPKAEVARTKTIEIKAK